MANYPNTPASNLYRLVKNTPSNQNFYPRLINTVQVNQNTERLFLEDDIILEAVTSDEGVEVYYRDDQGNAVNEFGQLLTAIPRVNMDAVEPKSPKGYYAIAKAQIDDEGRVKPSDAELRVTGIQADALPENVIGTQRIVNFSDGTVLSIYRAAPDTEPVLSFLDSSGKDTSKPKGESESPLAGFVL